MKIRALMTTFLAAALVLCTATFSFADSQKVSNNSNYSICSSLAIAKNGLMKKGSAYYCYQKGKMVKCAWKTIKGAKYYFQKNGKAAVGSCKVKNKYYIFRTNGKLIKGSKTRVVTIKSVKYQVTKSGIAKAGWNSGKTSYFQKNGSQFKNGTIKIGSQRYCFNSKGSLIKGDGLKKASAVDYVFLCADSRGVYNAARTKKLNSYTSYLTECTDLIVLLGTPKSMRILDSCLPVGVDKATKTPSKSIMYKYRNFTLVTFKASDGKEFFSNLDF